MCGIAGEFFAAGRARPLNLAALGHRGPDACGEWTSPDGAVWLGHTRLAILELSAAGGQPMVDRETGNVLVFNGEIYNHLEVRQRLGLAGDAWAGHSDTETLLVGYRVWGAAVLERLKGMFAFALYDHRQRGLFLARDRLGIKPLYYQTLADGLRFASETRLLSNGSGPGLDRAALAAYLCWGSCADACLPETGVHALAAGSWIRVDSRGALTEGRYWPGREIRAEPAAEAPERVRAWLETSVKEHLLADVPVASFLSGGIDSSVITALAARLCGGRLKTFSVGFADRQFDESAIALNVARRFGTDHQRIELSDAEILCNVREGVERMDLPSADALNTFIVAKAVQRAGIKVALSGLGGDELFGGYPSFRDVPRLHALPGSSRRLLRAACRWGAPAHRLSDLPCNGDVGRLTHWRRSFFSSEQMRRAGLSREEVAPAGEPALPDVFARVSWHELTGYMRNMLLRDADQMSMAVSLELRVPFLDHRLVEGVLGLPEREKTRRPGIKSLLVAACQDLLPPEVYQRPKMGFALPMDAWMRGPLRGFVRAGIEEVTAAGIIDRGFVATLGRGFDAGRLHWTRWWSMVVLGHYLARRARAGSLLN